MLEHRTLRPDIVGCYARSEAIDRLADAAERAIRVAPDELLLLGARERLREVVDELGALDAEAVVLDLSSGFGMSVLEGDDCLEAFCRLSELALPEAPAVVQGLFASVPAKIVVGDENLTIVVSSTVAHHVLEEVRTACADLFVRERIAVPEEATA